MSRATRRALPGCTEELAPVIHVHVWAAVVIAAPAVVVVVAVVPVAVVTRVAAVVAGAVVSLAITQSSGFFVPHLPLSEQ